MRTIKVTGKGNIKVQPDVTRISIELNSVEPTYDETLYKSIADTNQLKDLFAEFGFERSDLKTTYFNIDSEYENYKENNTYKERLIGYRYSHSMKLEFDSDNELLGKILYALGKSPLNPRFHISYTVKNPETAKNELLGKAVCDAKSKAVILTDSAGVKLGDIQNIDYSWGEIEFTSSPMSRGFMLNECCNASAKMSYDIDIEPDEIEVNDTVTVIWKIE